MNRTGNHVFAVTAICLGLLVFSPARVASQTEVTRSDWAGGVNLPSYVKMYIYVPKSLAAKPPIIVSSHACQSSVSGQIGANSKIKAAADKNGFIMIFPDNQGQNCWDVGSKQALTHDGGGDPHAVAQMVRYALKKYNGDSSRVYAVGGSSGGMMTQALLAIYPEIFMAGAPRAGVPCGCWSEGYAASNEWSDACANGSVSKTAQQWGDLVRAINPNYKGHRPRVQIFQGESDQTISFKNSAESIKEWTNVLNLKTNPDSTDKISSPAAGYNYNRKFWKNAPCGFVVLEAWSAPGQGHSMNYEEDAIMKFFGLNVAGGKDPEMAACATTPGIGGVNETIGSYKRLVFNDKTLILNSIQADKVSVTIVNASGRIQYNGNHRICSNKASISVPLSFLRSGYYIVSAVFFEGNKQVSGDNLRFVMTK
jgi:acetylxylan esterase